MVLVAFPARLFLQILAKQIIVSVNGEIIDHELHSPFAYLTTLVARSQIIDPDKRGSEQICQGAFENGEPPTIPVERFFAMLRFEQRGRLAELPVDVDSLR